MKKLYPLQFVEKEEQCIDYDALSPQQAKEAEENLKPGPECTEKSFIAKGFLAGNTLEDAVDTYLGSIVGDRLFTFYRGLFPLEIRIRSYRKRTPVYVSADDEVAGERFGCMGKERLWYVMSAEPGSSIYIGFRKSLSAQEIYDRQLAGDVLGAMNEIEPVAGETFYIRPGVPFAIGSGVEIAEVAQNSPVEFDIEKNDQLVEALDFIELGAFIPEYSAPEESFLRVSKINVSSPQEVDTEETGGFIVYLCLSGRAHIKAADGYSLSLTKRDIVLIPNEVDFTIAPDENSDVTLLRISPAPAVTGDEGADGVGPDEEGHGCGCGHHHDHNHGHDCGCGHTG